MNVYFLVEGKTESRVYPKWVSHFVPKLKRVNHPTEVIADNYFLISGHGYPSILDNFLVDSVEDVNSVGKFDYLVLVIDTDDQSVDEKIAEVELFIEEKNIDLKGCQLQIIPQVICMETWFLGNRKIYTRVPPNVECSFYSKHYDVSKNDPELMKKPDTHTETNADFHYDYLKAMLEPANIRYSKSRPYGVGDAHYIDELKKRIKEQPESLKSMRGLFDFFEHVQQST